MDKKEKLTCPVCENLLDHKYHVPVALPACGHTFCRRCLIVLQATKGNIVCPHCRENHTGAPPEDLPPNYAMLQLIDPVEEGEAEHPPENDAPRPPPKETGTRPKSRPMDNDKKTQPPPKKKDNGVAKGILCGFGAVVGGLGLVALAPVALTAAGFTSAGIAGSSLAASMMSSAAIANGGGIAAGSLVAVLQSAGAAGIGAGATAVLGATGAAAGAGVAKVVGDQLDEEVEEDKRK